jgi:hypothetical protein
MELSEDSAMSRAACLLTLSLSLDVDSKFKSGPGTGPKEQWAGLDSNQRRLTPTGLQPVPFSHSGTDPDS